MHQKHYTSDIHAIINTSLFPPVPYLPWCKLRYGAINYCPMAQNNCPMEQSMVKIAALIQPKGGCIFMRGGDDD
jgi:hypothetical protein